MPHYFNIGSLYRNGAASVIFCWFSFMVPCFLVWFWFLTCPEMLLGTLIYEKSLSLGLPWLPAETICSCLSPVGSADWGLLYGAALHCASQIFFYSLKVCGNAALIGTIFPMAFTHFMSQCHTEVILTRIQSFSLSSHLLWWSVIRELWSYYCNCFGTPQTAPM